MSYTPTEWATGDVVTAEKLNKIEGGITSAGVLVATVDMQTRALDKTWKQLDEAVFAVVKINEATNKLTLPVLITARESETSFMVASMSAANPATTMVFATTSEDGYPVIQA